MLKNDGANDDRADNVNMQLNDMLKGDGTNLFSVLDFCFSI